MLASVAAGLALALVMTTNEPAFLTTSVGIATPSIAYFARNQLQLLPAASLMGLTGVFIVLLANPVGADPRYDLSAARYQQAESQLEIMEIRSDPT